MRKKVQVKPALGRGPDINLNSKLFKGFHRPSKDKALVNYLFKDNTKMMNDLTSPNLNLSTIQTSDAATIPNQFHLKAKTKKKVKEHHLTVDHAQQSNSQERQNVHKSPYLSNVVDLKSSFLHGKTFDVRPDPVPRKKSL